VFFYVHEQQKEAVSDLKLDTVPHTGKVMSIPVFPSVFCSAFSCTAFSIHAHNELKLDYKSVISAGASTVKEQGHLEVRKSSSQVIRSQRCSQDFHWGCTFFLKKRFFLVVAHKTQAPMPLIVLLAK